MPTHFDAKDTPIVQFDIRYEISSYLIFRRLRDGKPVVLMDVREEPTGYTLKGAERVSAGWEPPSDRPVVLFDDDGTTAIAAAEHYHELGFTNVKALFGGLELWKFALDPEVVGQETFLVRLP